MWLVKKISPSLIIQAVSRNQTQPQFLKYLLKIGPKATEIAYSRGARKKSAVEGKAVAPPTLKGLWLLVVAGWRRGNFILAEEHFVSRNKQTKKIAFHTPRNL